MAQQTDKRWSVEVPHPARPGDTSIQDVGAEDLLIESGVLKFYDAQGRLLLAYAPGYWATVTGPEDDE